jgi:thermolysin
MTRLTAAAVAGAALFFSMQVGVAQQPSTVRVAATTVNDLRTWDGYVTSAMRSGDLRMTSVERDPSLPTRLVERMQQYYQGVPIFGAEMVRDSETGVARSIFGEVPQGLSLDVSPVQSALAAERQAIELGGADATLLRRAQLVILPQTRLGPRLAYMTVVSAGISVFRLFLDANTGAELLRYSELQTQAAVGTGRGMVGDTKKMSVLGQAGAFMADDMLRPPVLRTYDMRGNRIRAISVLDGAPLFTSDLATDTDNDWTDVPAVDAHAYIGWTYDYYFKRHGRRGLDNRDRPIITLINGVRQQDWLFTPPEDLDLLVFNAFWCQFCGPGAIGVMYFGNGAGPQVIFTNPFGFGPESVNFLAGSLDIAAHELTHAVTSSTSNLIYLNESGALNEAFSDIMGTAAEFYFQPAGAGIGQADFLMGEDSFRSPFVGGISGIRSMINPASFGDPDHYSIRFTGTADNGGVHINAGIPNHAFYLAVAGGTNRVSRLSVTGVGIANMEQMERVFYRAFTLLMPANSTFSTARAATMQAARDLYAANPAVLTAVTQAWAAVGVN